jgi:hypothetical protein
VEKRRQWLLTLLLVLGAHLAVVWFLLSSHQLAMKSQFGSLQLVWIPKKRLPETTEPRKTSQTPAKTPLQHPADTPSSTAIAHRNSGENNAIHPTPDWNSELQLAAKNALTNELAKKKHDTDFAHAFPTQPQKPAQLAWDHAATHRVESLPQGGLLIHINDNCVLLLFPLPLVGCGIGKHPANGDLFEHMREK